MVQYFNVVIFKCGPWVYIRVVSGIKSDIHTYLTTEVWEIEFGLAAAEAYDEENPLPTRNVNHHWRYIITLDLLVF